MATNSDTGYPFAVRLPEMATATRTVYANRPQGQLPYRAKLGLTTA